MVSEWILGSLQNFGWIQNFTEATKGFLQNLSSEICLFKLSEFAIIPKFRSCGVVRNLNFARAISTFSCDGVMVWKKSLFVFIKIGIKNKKAVKNALYSYNKTD